MSTQRDTLRAAIANATSFQEQVAAVTALDEYDRHQAQASKNAASLDWADTTVRQTLSPVAVHERSTIDTDWLGEAKTASAGQSQHAVMAEAAMWFGRTSAEVKADAEEFGIQAEGFMRREASKYGEDMDNVLQAGLDYLGFLWRRQAASGLDQIQQTVDPHENPKPTQLPTQTFDNFAPEVHPINSGVVGTETSERAPLLQEIESEGGGQGQPEVPGGHSTTNEPTGPAAPFGNTVADSGNLGQAQAAWDGPSVAIAHTYSLDDFRPGGRLYTESASGLDQVQQVVDPHEDPKPTALPVDVAFPWLITEDAYGNGGDSKEKDVEHSASRLPFDREQAVSKAASLKTAGGDFYRDQADPHQSWYDHPDYFTHYQHGYDSSGRYGEEGEDEDGPYTHDLTRGESEHAQAYPNAGNGARSAWMDGWVDRSSGNDTNRMNYHNWKNRQAARKQADMFGNSDTPHGVPGAAPSATGPAVDESAGAAQGRADALAGNQPTFADASSEAPANVQEYTKAYADTVRQEKSAPAKDFPMSADQGASANDARAEVASGGAAAVAKRSLAFTASTNREDVDFKKGYAFASRWDPTKPLVTTGSPLFESGLFAGIVDGMGVGSAKHAAWRTAHRTAAAKDAQFGNRIEAHDAYLAHLANHGVSVTAGTTTDLDTYSPEASPSPTGQTPINGPGTPPPLEGGTDPARPGGPSPYNGVQPLGTPVVPNGVAPASAPGYINDAVGGPVDGNTKSLAFRQRVQASLQARQSTKEK